MTIPWSGFPLKDLVDFAKPLSGAKYVEFETFQDKDVAPGQRQFWYPWPYIEGLTIEEATNELAFMVTGAYGKPMAKQYGSLRGWREHMEKAQDREGEAFADLVNIDGIGPSVADDLLGFCAEAHNRDVLDQLEDLLTVEDFQAPDVGSSPIAGKTVVFTGTLETLSRAEALRRASLALMADDEAPFFAHPMFWAPFVVIGEGGALGGA